MNTATRCAYTALTLSPARASHTRQLPGGASCDPGLFFSLGARHSGPGAAAGLNPPSPSASRRYSHSGACPDPCRPAAGGIMTDPVRIASVFAPKSNSPGGLLPGAFRGRARDGRSHL